MRTLLAMTALLIPTLSVAGAEMNDAALLEKSRQVVMTFQKSLGSKLKAAMQSGGPVKAIDVCSTEAMPIAENISETYGAVVKRVTDKPRNPSNQANADELTALQQLADKITKEQGPYELLTSADHGHKRYYKAIKIQPLCLTCHGDKVSSEVSAALAKHYPNDQATGYQLGELRGTFVIDWPAP